jgi:general nucleoside transport system permease protein
MSKAAVVYAAGAPRFDWVAAASVIAPFAIALIVGAVLLVASGRNPFEIYGLMVTEGFGGVSRIAATLSAATPILMCAVATAISFRAGVFNVGVEGGFYVGGLAGAVVGFTFTGLPSPVLIVAELAVGAAFGAALMTLPGFLKARLEVDEVVSTLMLNFVAINLTGFLVNTVFLAPRTGNSATPMIVQSGWLPRLVPSSTFNLGFIIALVLLVAYHLWDRYAPLGFEARMTGLNARFSRAVGIDVPALIMKVMILSGLIAGLGGSVHAAGLVHRFTAGFSPGYGFTGLAVALLGRNSAIGMLLGSILFGALASAGTTIQLFSDIPIELVDVLQGTVTVFAVVRLGQFTLRRRGGRP